MKKYSKTRRGHGKSKISDKSKMNNNNKSELTIVGTNACGLNSKCESLSRLIKVLTPSLLLIQESRCRIKGQFLFDGYTVLEKIRDSSNGGGLLTTVNSSLKPVLLDC